MEFTVANEYYDGIEIVCKSVKACKPLYENSKVNQIYLSPDARLIKSLNSDGWTIYNHIKKYIACTKRIYYTQGNLISSVNS